MIRAGGGPTPRTRSTHHAPPATTAAGRSRPPTSSARARNPLFHRITYGVARGSMSFRRPPWSRRAARASTCDPLTEQIVVAQELATFEQGERLTRLQWRLEAPGIRLRNWNKA